MQARTTTIVKRKLANFSIVAERSDPMKTLKSPEFQVDFSTIKCQLFFNPTNPKDKYGKDYSSLFLFVQDFADHSTLKLRHQFWIENELGEKIAETKGKILSSFLNLIL